MASEDNESNGMLYLSREAILNRMTYKKSAETLRLNERPHRNLGIRPIKDDLWALPKRPEVKGIQQGFTDENFQLKKCNCNCKILIIIVKFNCL